MTSSVIRAAIGKAAPHFKATAFDYGKQGFVEKSLTDFKGQWLLLFFYPLDFTFVCPTEIIEFSHKAKDFKQINCEVLGCSIDSHFCHMEYTKKERADGGLGKIDIPLLSDVSKKIGDAYGVLNDAGICYRGTFLIDHNQIVRHLSINDLPVGRNVDEYLRLVKVRSM
jgi:alkyl hydroperoxide reductase subunit AhpC